MNKEEEKFEDGKIEIVFDRNNPFVKMAFEIFNHSINFFWMKHPVRLTQLQPCGQMQSCFNAHSQKNGNQWL